MKDNLSIIADNHKKWVNIVRSLGETNYHEDIVQETYLKIHKYNYDKRIVIDGKVSSGYMYMMLRDTLYSYWRVNNKIIKEEVTDFNFFGDDLTGNEKEDAYLIICENIDKEIDTWHWYDKEIFKIYRMHWTDVNRLNKELEQFEGKVSIRKMAKNTDISWTTLFNELKQSKAKIRDKFAEDWEDYKNEDYNLIKKQ